MTCIYCGCDEWHACETEDGPCAWVSERPAVCSAPDCAGPFTVWIEFFGWLDRMLDLVPAAEHGGRVIAEARP